MASSAIQPFMADRCVLVTGFTGFLGKLLVAKILTSCGDVDKVFVLMRKGVFPNVQDRLANVLESKVFYKLKELNQMFHEKIIPIEGDIVEIDLGMSPADKDTLVNKVSVIFHLAQISQCDANLKDSLETNVHGTKKLLTLAEQMSQLVSVVHLSSVYSNCNHATISEVIYQPALHPRKLLGASEWVSDEVFKEMESFLMKGYANSFTYTKSLSEFLIQEQFSQLPVSIVRPGIIGSTWREPFPDWIDSRSGIVPIVKASGKGMLRVLKGNPKYIAELIPADSVVNTLLATTWQQSMRQRSSDSENSVLVYNLTSNAGRRLTWQTLEQVVCASFRKNPLSSVIRIPRASMTSNSLLYGLKDALFHVFPAYGSDIINLLIGRTPMYVNNMRQFLKLLQAVQYFTCRDWKIDNHNVKELMSKLNSTDKKIFGIDTSCTHWPTYLEGLCMGVKQYVAKEPLSGLPAARTSINRIWWANRFWDVVIFLIFIRLASTRLQWAKKIWTYILTISIFIYKKLPKIAKS